MTPELKERIARIRRGEIPHGYKRTEAGLLPKNWSSIRLNEVSRKCLQKNPDFKVSLVFSNSAQNGIIPQEEQFDKSIANKERIDGYYILNPGDFVYNPRISVTAPCGPINRNERGETGIVSPLYTVFTVDSPKVDNVCLTHYFKSSLWFSYMKGVANYGVRHDRMNISDADFFAMPLPIPPLAEQRKIAEILSAQDKVIELKERLLTEKQRQKKYLMQQFLTGKRRLPGFGGEWKILKLCEVLTERKETNALRNLRICSVAVNKGVIDQIEHLGRSYAASDTSNYGAVHYGDIVYTKSPTGAFPYGIIKQSHLNETVAVSPLYGIFKPVAYEIGYLLHTWFGYASNANNYLFPIIQKGAKNTINISNATFLSKTLSLPADREEQKALADVFSAADREIDLLRASLEQEKRKKKALSQLLLTGIVRV